MDKIKIELTKEECVVFFEFLSRFEESEKLTLEHESEKIVLWILNGCLEKQLVEPFQKNYKEILSAARKTVSKCQAH